MATFMILILLAAIAIIFYFIFVYNANKQKSFISLKIGDKAPNFSLKDENGIIRNLTDYDGKRLVLYFYPKDFTPGCTKEACNFRDIYQTYQENNIEILGISYDDSASHKMFKEQHSIPYHLLSDTTREVAKKYGAYQSIRNTLFPERITYLIDENSKIVYIFHDIALDFHAQEILRYFNHEAEAEARLKTNNYKEHKHNSAESRDDKINRH